MIISLWILNSHTNLAYISFVFLFLIFIHFPQSLVKIFGFLRFGNKWIIKSISKNNSWNIFLNKKDFTLLPEFDLWLIRESPNICKFKSWFKILLIASVLTLESALFFLSCFSDCSENLKGYDFSIPWNPDSELLSVFLFKRFCYR